MPFFFIYIFSFCCLQLCVTHKRHFIELSNSLRSLKKKKKKAQLHNLLQHGRHAAAPPRAQRDVGARGIKGCHPVPSIHLCHLLLSVDARNDDSRSRLMRPKQGCPSIWISHIFSQRRFFFLEPAQVAVPLLVGVQLLSCSFHAAFFPSLFLFFFFFS